METFTCVVVFVIGILLGAGVVWAAVKNRMQSAAQAAAAAFEPERAQVTERLAATGRRLEEMRAECNKSDELNLQLQAELTEEKRLRSAAEAFNSRIPELEQGIRQKDAISSEHQREVTALKAEEARLRTELANTVSAAEERLALAEKQFQEKLDLLVSAREELSLQFKIIAGDILEKSTRTFTEQNKTNLDALLGPLGSQIKEFEKAVEEAYAKESNERFSLGREVKNLQELNTRISQEAVNLTHALQGQTKTQGIWGEVILERVLESSGLVKGREYETQVCDRDEDGRRLQPDVIIHLPEDRHLIIDSKVNLKAYERFCATEPGAERDEELRKHLLAFRRHIDQLSRKEYHERFPLNSVDYVMMFVPVEPAYALAVGQDQSIFEEALRKKVVIVTPSTTHAVLRTIALVWRQENQSKNAMEIAQKSGALYNKFFNFVQDLENVGAKLQAAQESYDEAHKKLTSGRGNLIRSAEAIRELGVRTKKKLPGQLVAASGDDGLVEDSLDEDCLDECVGVDTSLADASNDAHELIPQPCDEDMDLVGRDAIG